ncbi:hypothetical protein PENSUB_967, partial [Penicillium subrubescens]
DFAWVLCVGWQHNESNAPEKHAALSEYYTIGPYITGVDNTLSSRYNSYPDILGLCLAHLAPMWKWPFDRDPDSSDGVIRVSRAMK